jgi:hypothetical protein
VEQVSHLVVVAYSALKNQGNLFFLEFYFAKLPVSDSRCCQWLMVSISKFGSSI